MEEQECEECVPGAPMWIVTFSDLMSLMLTFFVLILSFSELDAQKFKKASGSIRLAFGVQREMIREQIPLGISIVAEQYSAGEPTVLEFDLPPFVTSDSYALERRRLAMLMEDMREVYKKNKSLIDANLKDQVKAGTLKVVRDKFSVRIIFEENKAFIKDTDKIQRGFLPTLKKMARTIQKVKGKIRIHSHTGEDFKANSFFRNPWELTAGQSAALANVLAKFTGMESKRFEVRAHGNSKPVSEESIPEQNRRTEIEIAIDPTVMREFEY